MSSCQTLSENMIMKYGPHHEIWSSVEHTGIRPCHEILPSLEHIGIVLFYFMINFLKIPILQSWVYLYIYHTNK